MQEPTFKTEPSESSLRDFYYIVFRHKQKLIMFFIFVMAAVILGTLIMPNIYRSDAKLLVQIGRESIDMDPTAPASERQVIISQHRENELNSELEILTSEELAGGVVDAFGADIILKGKGSAEKASPSEAPKQDRKRNKAVLQLIKNLNVEVVKKSNIIALSYETKSPQLATDVLLKYIDIYMEKRFRVHGSKGTYDFFKEQKEKLYNALAQTEGKIKDIKNRTNVGSLLEQRPLLLERIASLQREIETTESSLAASKAKVDLLKSVIATLPERLVIKEITGGSLSASDQMRTAVNELKLKESDILSTFTAESVYGQEIRRQIREAKKILGDAIDAKTVEQGLNEIRQKLKLALVTEDAELASFQAKSGTINGQMANARVELKDINDTEVLLSRLDRDKEIQEYNYRKYSRNLEQSRIDGAVEKAKISNISILQSPVASPKPVRPKPLLNLLLGLCLGIIGGLGVVLVSNSLEHSFKKPEDIEEKLNIPALGAIPFLYAERGGLPTRFDSSSEMKRYCEILLERVLSLVKGKKEPPRIFSITSCHKGEGVSSISVYLASVLAEQSKGRVLLVDANLPNPIVHRFFDVDQSPGLTDILISEQSKTSFIQPSPISNLDLLCSGEGDISGKARLFESKTFNDLLNYLKNEYSFIVLDTPAVWEENHAVTLGSVADGVIMIVEAESVRWEVAQRAKERLAKGGANLIGAVLNKRHFYVPGWLYKTL